MFLVTTVKQQLQLMENLVPKLECKIFLFSFYSLWGGGVERKLMTFQITEFATICTQINPGEVLRFLTFCILVITYLSMGLHK